MKSITWDYDKGLITEWLRLGGCNNCGECCRVMVYMDGHENLEKVNRDGETFTSGKGIWHEWEAYGRKRYWQLRVDNDTPCNRDCYLELQDKCHNGSHAKGLLCTAWPLHPNHVDCFDDCSFKFVKINEWEMDDDSKLIKKVDEIREELEVGKQGEYKHE